MYLIYCTLAATAVFVAISLIRRRFPGLRAPGLPPGPPCLPVIGNLHQLPKTGAHFKFTEWKSTYGPIFSVKLGPQTMIVLNSPYMVKQLIDKQSAIFSDRPKSYIADNLMLHGDHLMFMGPDARWRRGRRLYHQFFNEALCEKSHHLLQDAEASQLLRDLCNNPDGFMGHCKRYSNSIIMSLVLGIRTPTPAATHMKNLYKILDGFSEIFEMGATPPVDIFPFFAWIPQRVFGNWKTNARKIARTMDSVYGPLVDRVLKRRETGQGKEGETYLDMVLDQQDKLQLTRHEIDLMVGNLLEGGSDTTAITLIAFIQAMALYPNVQREAQEVLDQVIGEDRTPCWNDYAALPYISMVVKETMRWRPVMPTAFAHATSKECTIDGMTIPAGSTVMMNVWGLHHDEEHHHSPNQFNPARYKNCTELANVYASSPDYKKRDHYGYGAGRRICPGIHLAERGLFIAVSKILWAFEISLKRDASGKVIPINSDPRTGYTEGFLRCAKPYSVEIKPRSEERRKVIMAEFERAEKDVFSKYEV